MFMKESNQRSDTAFVMALCKQGFTSVPRILVHYALELGLSYETLGVTVVLLSELAGGDGLPGQEFQLNRTTCPGSFKDIEILARKLDGKGLIDLQWDSAHENLTLSFRPMFQRLIDCWQRDQDHRSGEVAGASRSTEQEPSFHLRVSTDGGVPERIRSSAEYAARRLGRPLSGREVDSILHWVDDYQFSEDLIKEVIDEGLDRGISRFSYLNRVAQGWYEEGVRNLDDADRSRMEYQRLMAKHGKILRYLSLSRPLTGPERKLLDKWSSDWGFSDEVIMKACDTTVNLRDPNFRYIDQVLASWREKGVRTVDEAERELRAFRQQKPRSEAPGRTRKAPLAKNFEVARSDKEESYYEQFIERFGK